jgi:hypothetical protein
VHRGAPLDAVIVARQDSRTLLARSAVKQSCEAQG